MYIGQEEVKLSFFEGNIIVYEENPKDSTEELLELTHKFSKISGYKVNIRKLIFFFFFNKRLHTECGAQCGFFFP